MVYQTALLQVCFLRNPAHCIGLEALKLTKKTPPSRYHHKRAPNQNIYTSYPTLQAIEAYPKGRHTHQLSPDSLSSPS